MSCGIWTWIRLSGIIHRRQAIFRAVVEAIRHVSISEFNCIFDRLKAFYPQLSTTKKCTFSVAITRGRNSTTVICTSLILRHYIGNSWSRWGMDRAIAEDRRVSLLETGCFCLVAPGILQVKYWRRNVDCVFQPFVVFWARTELRRKAGGPQRHVRSWFYALPEDA